MRGDTSGGGERRAAAASVGVVLVAVGLGCCVGGATVVTVSGGRAVRGVAVMLRLGGTTTVAEVEALSPPLTITTLAMTASTKTMPAMAAIGRQR